MNENVSLVISRQLLTDVSTHLGLLADSVSQDVSHFALDVIQPRVISFEEQVMLSLAPTLICCMIEIYMFEMGHNSADKENI